MWRHVAWYNLLLQYPTWNTEAVDSPETSVCFYQSARRRMPKDLASSENSLQNLYRSVYYFSKAPWAEKFCGSVSVSFIHFENSTSYVIPRNNTESGASPLGY